MAQSDIETFLYDLLLRYDPSLDTSDGSRAQTEIINPILGRIGSDPFDADIETFVLERISQTFPDLSITQTSALNDTLISPMRVLLEPLVREIKLVKLRQSINNVESLGDEEVDALMANFFEARTAGGFARGVVRVYFAAPMTVSFTLIQVASTRSGLRYVPTSGQTITKDVMLLNREGSEYYVDITYVAEKRGDEYNVGRNEVTTISNLSTASRARNLNRFSSGLPRENSLDFVSRVSAKLSDRTLTVARGIISELTDNFPAVRRIQVVGFQDPEMQRDVVKGGGLGGIVGAGTLTPAYGVASAIADGTGASKTYRILAPAADFTSLICSAGSDPTGFYLTIMVTAYGLVVVDAAVLEVFSMNEVRTDYALDIGTPLAWALRKKELTISDIPGGITLPDTAAGDLILSPGEVHIGGKTDIYLAGDVTQESVAIDGISDEAPLQRGGAAKTTAFNDVVTLTLTAPADATGLVALMAEGFYSLVLGEGADAGSYDVRSVAVGAPTNTVDLRLSADMTTTASGLLWKIVDEIDIELTEPKDIKLDAADLTTVAGNVHVTTLGSTNFLDANVQVSDVLRVDADGIGGDYTITVVGAVTLQVSPTPSRTLSGLKYTIFRPSRAVRAPVVRVTAMELLDSGGAPNGVTIPYREPLATISRGFQNEGSGVTYEGYVPRVGLVGGARIPSSTTDVNGQILTFYFSDAEKIYAAAPVIVSLTLTGLTETAATICGQINVAPGLLPYQVRASVLTYNNSDYIGIASPWLTSLEYSGAAVLLGFGFSSRAASNAQVELVTHSPRVGDLLEFLEGANKGGTRVLRGHASSPSPWAHDTIILGDGPSDEDMLILGLGLTAAHPMHSVRTLLPEAGVRIRVGRPSVGSARVYFQDPTSAEFRYASTEFTAVVGADTLTFRPDPENDRILQPAPPLLTLPLNGTTSSSSVQTFGDATVDFQALNLRPGDLLDVLYAPLASGALDATTDLLGKTLFIRLGENPWITVTFAADGMLPADIAAFINTAVGEDIAAIVAGTLVLMSPTGLVSLGENSDASAPLFLINGTTTHPKAGTYIISAVGKLELTLSVFTPFADATAVPDTAYRVRRNVQRISSTEMNANVDSTGLYYVDVEMLSLTPGNTNNISGELSMTATGVVADGYRLYTNNPVLSFSRAEKLHASFSRTMLLVGSSDSPDEYVQLSQQNIQVSYDRSQLVDDVQGFCDSDNHRVINEEIIARHLLPHYVDLNWRYAGGESEIAMRAAITTVLEEIEANEELEVLDLTRVMTSRGATSVYSPAPDLATGRTAPVMVVTHHDIDRNVRAEIVKDFVKTSRTQRFIAGDLAIVRVAPGGIR